MTTVKIKINTHKHGNINPVDLTIGKILPDSPTFDNKFILCDVDGVLLDWAAGFDKWMFKKGYTYKDSTAYLMEDRFENLTHDEGKKFIKEFNESEDIGDLEPLRDAVVGVRVLYSLGYNFATISSHSSLDEACERREECLSRIFGKEIFSSYIHLDTGADKDTVLERYNTLDYWWIEDKTENALAGAKVGLRSLLMHHDFNASDNHEELTRVHTWEDIVRVITTSA